MKDVTNRILTLLENIGMAIAILAMFVMMISISADAFGRYFLNAPIPGQYEFTAIYLMVILTFMGLARTQAIGGHISIPVLEPVVNAVPYQLPKRIASLLCAGGFGLMTVVAGEEALVRIAERTTTFGVVQFPTYLSYCWVPLGTALLTLRLMHQTIWPTSSRREAD